MRGSTSWGCFWVVMLLNLLLSQPCRAQAADYTAGIESTRQLRLANGLRAVIAVDRRTPQVALHVEYGVGDALDPPEQRGLARLIGAVLPGAATSHLSASERGRLYQAAGFKYEEPRVQVGSDTTSLDLDVPSEALELALWIEADRMGFAADSLTEQRIRDAAPDAAQSRLMSAIDPSSWAWAPAHPYAALRGTPNLSGATAAVVAQRLRRYYNPATAIVVLVGDIVEADAERALQRSFGLLRSAPIAALTAATPTAAPPREVRAEAPIPGHLATVAWITPPFLSADDLGLDLVADLLSRRLSRQGLCDKVEASQRSRFVGSVFSATCTGPKSGSAAAWQHAVEAQLAELAEGKVSTPELESAALTWQRIASERLDDLRGRAASFAAALRLDREPRFMTERLKAYAAFDVNTLASVVRRTLLQPPAALLDVVPAPSAPKEGRVLAGVPEPTFRLPSESAEPPVVKRVAWSRPPAVGRARRYQPPLNFTETLPSGDRLLFVQRDGLPLAEVLVLVPWRTPSIDSAAAEVLKKLLVQDRSTGATLEQTLRELGARVDTGVDSGSLGITVTASPSRLPEALRALAAAFWKDHFLAASFDDTVRNAAAWTQSKPDFRWIALGLSAPTSRYRTLQRGARERALSTLKLAEVEKLWSRSRAEPFSINVVGPFDVETARNLAKPLTQAPAGHRRHTKTPAKVVFSPGVYLVDNGAADSVEGCVLWPLPAWPTRAHAPAHLMPWFFTKDLQNGLNARLAENGAREPKWRSNTLLTGDGDFLHYCFTAPQDQVAPILKSLQAHTTNLAEGRFDWVDLLRARQAEQQYQVRQSLSTDQWLTSLYRASIHEKDAADVSKLPSLVGQVDSDALRTFAKDLSFDRATIALLGSASALTAELARIGLKPSAVSPVEAPASNTAKDAP
ncbi:MAG TPA: insulinase family protein [Polyangiaceae bacterium]|nr:insulinase family protein [Polyangiaceae bacterium]